MDLKALLLRKVGPAPVWVYCIVAVLGLAWYLRSRKKPAATEEDTTGDTNGVLDQFALAYPMPYQGGVSVETPSTSTSSGTTFSDPYVQSGYEAGKPYGRTGVLKQGATLEGLSEMYWGDKKYANLLYLANIDVIERNKGSIIGLDLIVPQNPQYGKK